MSIQTMFRKFHEAIQLNRFDENAELREKRDRILKRMRDNLGRAFEWFNQGSYAMGTGVKPLDSDYDIDIGVIVDLDRAYNPCDVKGWVYQALDGHTSRVEWRRPCITVFYQQGGESQYHVDLAVLGRSNGQLYLAIGKQHSAADQREWQRDDRKGFMTAVENKFAGEDAAQFRRVIRYLKRWRDVHFASEGRAAPTGLMLTVAAYLWFQPGKIWSTSGFAHDDLTATLNLTQAIHRAFGQVWNGRDWGWRLSLKFPFQPMDDVCSRMTDQQMLEFRQRLQTLNENLEQARTSGVATSLRRAFGTDFPER